MQADFIVYFLYVAIIVFISDQCNLKIFNLVGKFPCCKSFTEYFKYFNYVLLASCSISIVAMHKHARTYVW